MIKKVFWAQVIVFLFIAVLLFFPLPMTSKRNVFPLMAVSSLLLLALGIYLLYLVKNEKVKGPLRKWLIIVGLSSSGFLLSVVLHNFFYALGALTSHILFLHYLFEILHASFFIIGTIICPLGFVVGVFSGYKLLIHTQD